MKKDVAKHPDAYQYERARTVSARSLGIFTPISIPLSILGLNVSFSKGLYIVLSTLFLRAINCSNPISLWLYAPQTHDSETLRVLTHASDPETKLSDRGL